ncbi:MAG: zinc-dependent alcohol dehydrogenase family protein [Saprospiraceae bacterium]|nr:zinc-dependent alcohol dehydrogenase family protein [Saprospiraceae bacterium]MDP4997854.1 zinc-dependent alcohol dehydrogenase family protein [Saprospiraceae bacterium]
MKAAIYYAFGGEIAVTEVPDPACPDSGVVIEVGATGICRSDWHGWMGHDSDVRLPQIPGHEFAGTVVAVGSGVKRFQKGDRVTLPFCLGCGSCPQCTCGHQQICDHYQQPGFTLPGSFAEFTAIPYADTNLVHLPDEIDFQTAAVLGCRFITSFRAVVDQGRIQAGQYLLVIGCGGVGLSAVLIGVACGATVIAVDIDAEKLALAAALGAAYTLNAALEKDIPEAVQAITGGGCHVSLDALGSITTCVQGIRSLRKRGKHIQVGLMTAQDSLPPIPMGRVISHELEILGSHGMQAHRYPEMLRMIERGVLQPARLLTRKVNLETGAQILQRMNTQPPTGVTVIDHF